MLKQKIFTYTIITLISVLTTFSWEYFKETKYKATFETHPIISTNISKNYQNYDHYLETLILEIHRDNHRFLRNHLLDNFRKSETIKNPRFVVINYNDMKHNMFTMEFKDLESAKKEIFDQINLFQNFIKKRTIGLIKPKLSLEDENPILTLLEIGKQTLNKEETYFEILDLIKEYGNETQPNNNESKIKIDKFLTDLKIIYNNLEEKNNNQYIDIKKKIDENFKIRMLTYEKVLKEIESTEQFFIFKNLQFESNKNYPLSILLSILAGMAVSFLFFEIFRKKNIR